MVSISAGLDSHLCSHKLCLEIPNMLTLTVFYDGAAAFQCDNFCKYAFCKYTYSKFYILKQELLPLIFILRIKGKGEGHWW